jgi:uncharacterized protein (TIGR03437 family)
VQICAGVCGPPFRFRVVPAHPNLFTSPGSARAIAYTVGSIATVFLTGAGVPSALVPDGGSGVPGQGAPALPVRASIDGVDCQVLYAGSLSGTVNGVVQLNLQLPPSFANSLPSLVVSVGGTATQAYILAPN